MNKETRTEKDQYIKDLERDHKLIEEVVSNQWNVQTQYLENIFWGYNTSAFYIKAHNNEYILRTTKNTVSKQKLLKIDLGLSKYLNNVVPTSMYLKTTKNKDFYMDDKRIYKLSKYIQGVPPFDMSLEIFKQAVEMLYKIHQTPPPPQKTIKLKIKGKTLLHGDLTPSNILISHDKVVGILDFELAFLGPAEYDIARASTLSWFRLQEIPFQEFISTAEKAYEKELDRKLLLRLSKHTAEKHLANIVKYKGNYENEKMWLKDYLFAQKIVERLNKITSL